MEDESTGTKLDIQKTVQDILGTIEREREREIISRRFGLFDRRETLEQIGELLGITRERVRQLEKAVVTRLKVSAEQGSLPNIPVIQDAFLSQLNSLGGVARVSELSQLFGENNRIEQARTAFLAQLCPELVI